MSSFARVTRIIKALQMQLGRLGLAYGVIALVLLVALVFSFVQRSEIVRNFAYRGDSPSYLVAQLEREFLRMREVLHVAVLHPAEIDRDALALRGDILSSRIDLLNRSPVMTKISTTQDFIDTVREVTKFCVGLDAALAAPTLDVHALAALLHSMGDMEPPLQALGLSATAIMARDSEAAYTSLLNQNGLIIALSLFQLLFLSLAAWSMAQQNRWREAERQALAQANRQLLRNEERLNLAASVFQHAHESIVVADEAGLILEINDNFIEKTLYAQQDLLGLHVNCLVAERSEDMAGVEVLLQSVKHEGHWLGERLCRRKDGSEYPAMLSISAVHSAEGRIKRYALFFNDITDLKKKQQELEYVANYDVLTALPNRSLFRDRLKKAIESSVRQGKSLAVAFIDLDGFKEINDSFGHAVGDQLLVALAQRMNLALRAGDSIARLGGDEFIVLVTGLDHTDACIPVLERLLAAASSPLAVADRTLQVSASIGVTVFPDDKVNVDHLVRHADQAMYRAKQSGKNQYAFFDSAHEKPLDVTLATVPEIKLGLQRGEFVLHYQPKVQMQSGEVAGVEALIRWNHPTKGLLPPAAFLPQIEGKPISLEVSAWVIADALRQVVAWQRMGLQLPVSVNVGALHLQHARFYDDLYQLMHKHPQCRGMLSIEILETSALSDMERMRAMMQKCQAIGVEFALDDFGTGYSSLSYLSDLPAQEVKIDQRFVKNLASEQNHLSIVEGIVSLTRAFRRAVVAEGVETQEVGELLLRLGCKMGQGYYIARPMPADALADWLQAWAPPATWREPATLAYTG